MDVIATHENADFDGLACLVAARHLYPGAVAACPTLLDRSVREYVRLHGDALGLQDAHAIELDRVMRLVIVDASDPGRLGRLGALAERDGIEIIVFDHHGSGAAEGEEAALVRTDDGALTTTLLGMLSDRAIDVSAEEATLFALGIHQDTGSLTYQSTTARDAEALGYCYRRGADLASIERFLRLPLRGTDRALLHELLEAVEVVEVRGEAVHLASLACPSFPDGAAQVVDKLAELTEARALVVVLEHAGRVSCIVRSRGASIDAGALAGRLGGGGHPRAAAASFRATLDDAIARVRSELRGAVRGAVSAEQLMSTPPRFASPATTVQEAMTLCRQTHVSGLLVGSSSELEGVVLREDLDSALAHGLGHAPVLAVMNAAPLTIGGDALAPELRALLARPRVDRLAVERDGEIVGVITRRDLLREGDAPDEREGRPRIEAPKLDILERVPGLAPILEALDGLPNSHGRVFLVGGGVRDALLGADVVDIDLAVEGAAIELAEALADRLGGRATRHGDFGTATVTYAGGSLDVATTRSELYTRPGALPTVARATIESDLLRRDFTMNAMAVDLDLAERGRLIDPYGGERDISAGALRVLHNLSFVDDPTRLLRAARYEARYGFGLEPRSEALARACVALGLVQSLSGPRIGNELMLMLSEEAGPAALARLQDLGVLAALHPRLDGSDDAFVTMRQAEILDRELEIGASVWRLRLAVLTRRLDSSDRHAWLDTLQLARQDADAVASAAALASSLAERSAEAGTTELFRLLSREPIEAVLLATCRAEPGSESERALRNYLGELRHVHLEIDGHDLAELGLAESPAVGQVLDEVLALKLEGEIASRDEELDAARRLIREQEAV